MERKGILYILTTPKWLWVLGLATFPIQDITNSDSKLFKLLGFALVSWGTVIWLIRTYLHLKTMPERDSQISSYCLITSRGYELCNHPGWFGPGPKWQRSRVLCALLFDSFVVGRNNRVGMSTFTISQKIAGSVLIALFLVSVFAAVLIPNLAAGELPYIAWCHL